jgi:hypothetical protein
VPADEQHLRLRRPGCEQADGDYLPACTSPICTDDPFGKAVGAQEANLRHFVGEKGIASKDDDFASLCADGKVRDAALVELNAVGKRAGFKGLEQLQALVLTPEEWTPQSGLLTAAMKLQRPAIMDRYREDIKKCVADKRLLLCLRHSCRAQGLPLKLAMLE